MTLRIHVSFGVALLGYIVLVLLLFYPLFGQFSTAVPHDLGDPLLSTWILWWNTNHLPLVGSWWDGLSFFPAPGNLAFSDHRVGLMLLAGPVQWMGGSPVLAYNITLLASFALCAMAAHALTWTLTHSHAAGAVSGLIFGFNPFRISHIAHLELLAVFWLPLAFIALHRYVEKFERRWLWTFAACWALQGLSSGYYFFYSAPLVGLWALWFVRHEPARGLLAIGLAGAAALAALLPALLGYRAIHSHLNLTRGFSEIEAFSADVTGLLSATPIMALWRLPSLAANGEGEIYIGIFAPLLVLAGWWWRPRAPRQPAGRALHAFRGGTAVVCAAFALIAGGTLLGSWSLDIGPLRVSATRTPQPLTVVALCVLILGVTSSTFRQAVRGRSTLAFYTVAALLAWLFALGPRPRLLGRTLIHHGPYELLMLLPGFADGFRVPARFAMLTIFGVAVAAGIGFVRATASTQRTTRLALTTLVLLAIAADSWTFSCPMPTVPPLVSLPDGVPDSAAVLELPLGDVGPDIAAVYRSMGHGHSVVNGYSGYEPPHYPVLRSGLAGRDASALTALTRYAPIVVVINRKSDPGGDWAAFAGAHAGAVRLKDTATHCFYLLPRSPDQAHVPGTSLRIVKATSILDDGVDALTDGNLDTAWMTSSDGGEDVVLELEGVQSVTGLSLSAVRPWQAFPRRLEVAVSIDRARWQEVWRGGTAGPVVEAILKDPRATECRFPFEATPARFIRLRPLRADPEERWGIAEVRADGPSAH